jgi:hypothetical protein
MSQVCINKSTVLPFVGVFINKPAYSKMINNNCGCHVYLFDTNIVMDNQLDEHFCIVLWRVLPSWK